MATITQEKVQPEAIPADALNIKNLRTSEELYPDEEMPNPDKFDGYEEATVMIDGKDVEIVALYPGNDGQAVMYEIDDDWKPIKNVTGRLPKDTYDRLAASVEMDAVVTRRKRMETAKAYADEFRGEEERTGEAQDAFRFEKIMPGGLE